MFDIGGWEFLLIIVLGIIIIGPKELPATVRTVGIWVRKAKDLAREFQGGLEDIAREADLDQVKDELASGLEPNSIRQEIEDAIDPEGELDDALDFDADEDDWYSDAEAEEHELEAADGDDEVPSIEDAAPSESSAKSSAESSAEAPDEAAGEAREDAASGDGNARTDA